MILERTKIIREIVQALKRANWQELIFIHSFLQAGAEKVAK